MAGEGKITKDDLSVKDPFSYLTESAKVAQAQVESLTKDLDLILPKTQSILGGKSNTVADINAQIKAMDVLIARQKQARKAEEDLTVSKIALEKAEKARLITEREVIKNDRETIKNEKEKIRLNTVKASQEERNIKAQQSLIREQEKLNSAYNKVQTGLTSLSNRYRELAIKKEMGETLSAKEEIRLGRLQVLTLKYDQALKTVDANMGRHQRNVGNYASGWNGLGNSINQLTREMPAFANSMQTGFMAISNNLPILFDELSRIKKVNAEIIEQGGQTVSAWKQVGKAIFSLGTLLSVSVTLLTFYGAKMVETIYKMTGFAEAEKLAEKEQKQREATQKRLIESQKKYSEFIAKESSTYVQLIMQLKATNKGSKERSDLIEQINNQYGSTLKNISDETKFQNQLNQSVQDYIEYKRQEYMLKMNEEKINRNLQEQEKLRQQIAKSGAPKRLIDQVLGGGKASDLVYNLNEIGFASGKTGQQFEILVQKLDAAQRRLEYYGLTALKTSEKIKSAGFNNQTKTNSDKVDNVNNVDELLNLPDIEEPKTLAEINAYWDNLWIEIQKIAKESLDKLNKENGGVKILDFDIEKQKLDEIETLYKQKYLDILKSGKTEEEKIIEKTKLQIEQIKEQIKLEKYLKGEKADTLSLEIKLAELEQKNIEKNKEALNETIKASEQLAKIATEYYKNQLQAEINGLNNSLELVSRQMSVIEQKAALGNSRAEDSLKKQILLQEELNKRKLEAENKMAKLNLINSIVGTAGSIIQGFETGTEYEVGNYIKPNLSGVGIDNTLIRVHGKERIVNEDLSKQIVGRKTSDVVKNALAYEQMIRYPINQTIDMSETNELLRKVANKKEVEYNLGEITQTTFELIRKEIKGNTETNHIYKNKYKV